jgi:hypothetical protein
MPILKTDYRICKGTKNDEPGLYWNNQLGWVPFEQASTFDKAILIVTPTPPVGAIGIMESTEDRDINWYPYQPTYPYWGTPESVIV